MKARIILIALCIFFVSVLQVFAQEDCSSIFKAKLENVDGIKAVTKDQSGFLAILDSTNKSGAIKIASLVKKMRNDGSVSQCDFSGIAIALMNSDFDLVKSSTSSLKKSEITKLLYKYVYDLSPIEVDENLKGYEKLSELSPQNSYYAARKEHYIKRVKLINARKEFISRCLKDVRKDKSILDLKVKKDFYLFVTGTDTPLKTAQSFLDDITKSVARPDKKICIIAYSKDLAVKETSCPEEYKENLGSTEEELLMRHVQSIPSYKLQKNITGYSILKKFNPSSTLYISKLDSYKKRLHGLNKFLGISSASGEKVFSKSSTKGATLFATVNRDVLKGKSESANRKLFQTLTAYYSHSGKPYRKCVLINSGGITLGTISCEKNSCSFR